MSAAIRPVAAVHEDDESILGNPQLDPRDSIIEERQRIPRLRGQRSMMLAESKRSQRLDEYTLLGVNREVEDSAPRLDVSGG
ncbi:hypothetical protein [Pseudoclavibacter helvolus]|uniref:hypothetical protein n=1 Tax=Pseudoclavibacter helvolus TaxID=255205 RepID=UPI0024ADBDEE|nr:hypothetical protein [Pseudoclavibacter helvolus]